MPFDFKNPKGVQEPNARLKFNAQTIERRWPTDRYDITGGSFPVRVDDRRYNCEGCPGKIYDYSRYSDNYLRTNIMYQNPGTLCGLKNTNIMQRVLQEPPIQVTTPKFIHRPNRSTSHLRIPTKFKTAVCGITDNLLEAEQNSYEYKLRKLKADQLAAAHTQVNMDKAIKEFTGRFSRTHQVRATDSETGILEHKSARKIDPLLEVCRKGKLLDYVKKKVKEEVHNLELEAVNKRTFCFPSASKIAFEIEAYKKNPNGYPSDKYAYDPDGGMAMMCARADILSKFYETQDEKQILTNEADSSLQAMDKPLSALKFKRQKYTPSMMDIITKAPNQYKKQKQQLKSDDNSSYSHYHLLEVAKKEALQQVVDTLTRREQKVTIPKALTSSVYAHMKYFPDTVMAKTLPQHLLHQNYPPTQKELAVVEADVLHDKKARKIRRESGLKYRSESDLLNNYFMKPLLLSDDERSEISLARKASQDNKIPSQEQEILEDMCNEFKLFQESITPAIRKPGCQDYQHFSLDELLQLRIPLKNQNDEENPDFIDITPSKFCNQLKSTMKNTIEENNLRTKSELFELFSTSSSEFEYDQTSSNTNLLSDNFENSDIAFSDIKIPVKDVPGLRQNPFYRTIQRETKSSSSSGESLLSDTSYSELSELNLDEDFSKLDVDEQEGEEDDEDNLENGKEEFRDMLASILNKEDVNLIDDIFTPTAAITNEFRKSIFGPHKNKFNYSDAESMADPRDTHFAFWEKVFEAKVMREMERLRRVSDAMNTLKEFEAAEPTDADFNATDNVSDGNSPDTGVPDKDPVVVDIDQHMEAFCPVVQSYKENHIDAPQINLAREYGYTKH